MMEERKPIDFSMVLASSVHDMKNSIGMLLASLEGVIAHTQTESPEQTKHFNTLHYEASRINSDLVQLLTIYRMENSFLPIQVDEHYVIDVLEDQIARNHILLQTSDIKLSTHCDRNLKWYFDDDLLGSVIHNVFVNCVRYTKSRLLVEAEVIDDFLCITIADDGPGYPDYMLEKPPGYIAEDVSSTSTHLGLYFADRIVAMHKQHEKHGYILLENGEPYGGGVFKLFVP
ncbi:sensor histidine kinase [Agarilytica rhodophyticola]|uniref:sensor histidine kinase n=1 Tax=Agarilytica rhodophyticola TaxID=1737490 RepID=UPI001FE42D42|nr:HAMP domain-containing sensor histidine kinase [Agarilytica rhodophyticola]